MNAATAALRTINHVPAMLAYWGADERCLFANAAYYDWFGRSPDEMIGISLASLLGPVYEQNLPHIRGALTGAPQEFERFYITPDGRRRHSNAVYTPDVVDGVVVGFTALVTDVTTAHEREAELRRTTEILNRTGELAKVGGAELVVATGAVFWTTEMCRMLDVDPGNIPPADRWVDFFEPAGLPAYLAASERMQTMGTPVDLEMPMRTAKGNRLWARIRASVVVEDGVVTRLVSAHQDITERKAAEQALRESEELRVGVLDSVEDHVAVLDEHGVVVAVNRAWRRFGEQNGALSSGSAGMNYLGVLDRAAMRDDGDEAREAAIGIRGVLAGSLASYSIEYPFHSPLEQRWFQARVVPYVGARRGVVVAHRNVTVQRAEDEARRLSDAALKAVSQGVVIADAAQRVVWINDAFTAITGYVAADIVGKTMKRLQGASTDPATVRAINAALRDGVEFSGEIQNYRRDGSPFWNDLTISPVRDRLHQTPHYAGVVRDVSARHDAESERTRLQHQLQQAQKLETVGRLAGGVAHDFNNMLSVILGHVDLTLLEVHDETLREDLLQIKTAAQRSANITGQLLAFARQQVIAPTALDLNDVMAHALKLLGRLIGENVRLTWRPAGELWLIHMDPSQVDQIITNLCVNARDAISDVGSVVLQTENCVVDEQFAALHVGAAVGEYVRLTVRDDGHGMAEETLSHLFEPFFTTKTSGKGTGLGLATVYGAVQQNGGFITVTSAPGAGTTFGVYLPRYVGAPAVASVDARSSADARGNETILVVEDEAAILRLNTRVLERCGYRVLAASDPLVALRLASEYSGTIHLLLTDVVMPTMNGLHLATALRAARPSLACIFTSGYTADVMAARGVLEDGVHFLPKPCSPLVMARKLRDVLDSA
ncbi:PAS domain S-box protein [Gemmatimonas sp.]|uniref:hybrid sensor histidine kinase/response regulator n=1 Tax=Gemmatimonas sp. TaxID=1962908 RepID=UPI00356A863F